MIIHYRPKSNDNLFMFFAFGFVIGDFSFSGGPILNLSKVLIRQLFEIRDYNLRISQAFSFNRRK